MKEIELQFCSGVGTVTGANFLLSDQKTKILVDCGLVQGESFAESANHEPFAYDPREIKLLLVTHAHLDHVGRIPKLCAGGFKGPIYSTPQTKELAKLVLEDAVGILRESAQREGLTPLYDAEDVARSFENWQTLPYHEVGNFEGISFFFKDAGHVLGSAMIQITANDVKTLFTGDLGNSPSPLLADTEEVGDVDYVVMESTYGDKNHESRENRDKTFENIVKDTITRGGTLIIPAFSIDRTQILLYELNNMVESGRLPSLPVFVDSPMAIKATDIYRNNISLFNDHVKEQIRRGDQVFSFPKLQYTVSAAESSAIDQVKGPKIILAGSGMSVGGRVIAHEEKYLPDPRNTLLLVGYQTPGSLGRRLSEGEKKVNIRGNKINVKARIETMYGYSAHRDSDHLVQFIENTKGHLKKVFVAMGEPRASSFLAQRINNELDTEALVPERNKIYKLGK